MMKVCVITKMYVTARGGRGVCYTIGGKKAATFMPADLEGIDQVRAWLSESLGVPVQPAHKVFSSLDGAWLARLAGSTHLASQVKMLALGREHVLGLSVKQGLLVAKLASQSGEGSWDVRLNPSNQTARCTCPHATHNPHTTCKHVGALARLLLAHPDIAGVHPPRLEHVPTARALTRGLSVGWAYITHQRDGAVRLEGERGARWVSVTELLVCDFGEYDGRMGAWVGVRPGHALERIGLYARAPRAVDEVDARLAA